MTIEDFIYIFYFVSVVGDFTHDCSLEECECKGGTKWTDCYSRRVVSP